MPKQNTLENVKPHINPEKQVRATEDASLPDDAYSFDEDNTASEEFHDAGDMDEESDLTDIFESDDDSQ